VREPKTGGAGTVCGPVFKTLAEKAYIINNGQYDDSLKLKEEWTLDSAIEYSNENELEIIEDTLDDNIMPDLIGINMEDAIFILENKGFKVNYEGFGRVIAQSIASGTELQEKNNITLTLH
jgi:hypothetical protein